MEDSAHSLFISSGIQNIKSMKFYDQSMMVLKRHFINDTVENSALHAYCSDLP